MEYLGIYINRVTRNLTYVSVEKMPIFCEVTYYIETSHKTGSYFQNIDMIFQGSIYDHIKIPYTKFQVSVSFGSDSFKINKGYIAKKLPKGLKIAITRSNLNISKNKKLCF